MMETRKVNRRTFLLGASGLTVRLSAPNKAEKLLPVQRVLWLEETHCLEMFSAMNTGTDGRIYAGTCNAVKQGACLIVFDPKTLQQTKLADMQKVFGKAGSSTLPQSKIHSQICFDHQGVAWFSTHSYGWNTLDLCGKSPTDYTGEHLVTYSLRTKRAIDLGILAPHESIMSLALAERVGKVYCVLRPTGRFVAYDILTKRVNDKGTILDYPLRTTVALRYGRGYTFTSWGCGALRSEDRQKWRSYPFAYHSSPELLTVPTITHSC